MREHGGEGGAKAAARGQVPPAFPEQHDVECSADYVPLSTAALNLLPQMAVVQKSTTIVPLKPQVSTLNQTFLRFSLPPIFASTLSW